MFPLEFVLSESSLRSFDDCVKALSAKAAVVFIYTNSPYSFCFAVADPRNGADLSYATFFAPAILAQFRLCLKTAQTIDIQIGLYMLVLICSIIGTPLF